MIKSFFILIFVFIYVNGNTQSPYKIRTISFDNGSSDTVYLKDNTDSLFGLVDGQYVFRAKNSVRHYISFWQLGGVPTIPTTPEDIGAQATLVSGTNIKTVNGNSILGIGDVPISGTADWGSVGGNIVNQTDLQTALNGKLATNGNGSSLTGLTKTQVGLPNTDNTSDANKPVSTATQTALDGKLATDGNGSSLTGLTKSQVGLANADNTSDANKPISTAEQTALNLKANLASPTFTGTVAGVTAAMVGLGSATNESKATMFTSPTFTGSIIFPANQIGIPVFARVTGSNATTTGQSLVDITGLSISLIANATYEIEVVLSCQTTAVTTGTGYGIQYSAAGATIEGWVSGSSTTTAHKTLRLSAFNTSSQAFLTSSAQTGGIFIRGIVTVGANPGTLSARHLKVTSGTSTVFIGSYIKITRIL